MNHFPQKFKTKQKIDIEIDYFFRPLNVVHVYYQDAFIQSENGC